MKTKNVVILSLVSLLSGAALTHWLAPKSVKEVVVEKVVRDKDVRTEIIEVIKPDGSKETKTVIVDKSKTVKDSEKSKVITSRDTISISALAITSITGRQPLVFGAGFSVPVLGPLEAGLFGYTDGRVGASVSLRF